MTTSSEIVSLRQVSVWVGNGAARRTLVNGLTLSIRRGECIGIVGPNGSGKSTLLKVMMGLDGVGVDGTVVSPAHSEVSYVPQHYRKALFPWLSVAQNVALYQSGARPFSEKRFHSALSAVALQLDRGAIVGRLSGGGSSSCFFYLW